MPLWLQRQYSRRRQQHWQSCLANVAAQIECLEQRTLLTVPSLVAPIGLTPQPRPDFEWTAVENADHYDLWVNDVTAGTSGVIREMTVNGTTFTPTEDLVTGHEYIWTVRAVIGGVTQTWGTHRRFTVTVGAPTLLQPGGATSEVRPELQWTAVTGAVKYDLWVNNVTTGVTSIIRQTDLASMSFTPSEDLTVGHQYIWTVRGIDGNGVGGPWATHRKTTIVPAAPQILGPIGSTPSTRPVFSWTPVSGADRYDVWVNNLTTGEAGFIRDMNIGDTSFTPDFDIRPGDNLLWTVRGIAASGAGGFWATHRLFTPNQIEGVNRIASRDVPIAIPAVGGVTSQIDVRGLSNQLQDVNVSLEITHPNSGQLSVSLTGPGGTKIELVSVTGNPGANFTGTTLDDEASDSIADELPPFTGTFQPNQSLSVFDFTNPNGIWTLEINNTLSIEVGTLTSWSLEFTTDTLVLEAPTALTPVGQIIEQQPEFTWTEVAGADHYDIWVNNLTTGETEIIRNSNVADTTFVPDPGVLQNENRYIWTVRAIGANGLAGPFASHLIFSVDDHFTLPFEINSELSGSITAELNLAIPDGFGGTIQSQMDPQSFGSDLATVDGTVTLASDSMTDPTSIGILSSSLDFASQGAFPPGIPGSGNPADPADFAFTETILTIGGPVTTDVAIRDFIVGLTTAEGIGLSDGQFEATTQNWSVTEGFVDRQQNEDPPIRSSSNGSVMTNSAQGVADSSLVTNAETGVMTLTIPFRRVIDLTDFGFAAGSFLTVFGTIVAEYDPS